MKSNPLRLIILHFKNRHGPESVFYTDAPRVADATGLTSNVIGQRLKYIADSSNAPIECEPWSETGGSITYRVEMPGALELQNFLFDVRNSEPKLSVRG